jgi:hypothetical protein
VKPIETLFVVHTNSHNAYSDQMINIGQREGDNQLYYYEDDNHSRHDEMNHVGEAKWNKIEEYASLKEEKEGIENADILEDWAHCMSEEEKEIITKALNEE